MNSSRKFFVSIFLKRTINLSLIFCLFFGNLLAVKDKLNIIEEEEVSYLGTELSFHQYKTVDLVPHDATHLALVFDQPEHLFVIDFKFSNNTVARMVQTFDEFSFCAAGEKQFDFAISNPLDVRTLILETNSNFSFAAPVSVNNAELKCRSIDLRDKFAANEDIQLETQNITSSRDVSCRNMFLEGKQLSLLEGSALTIRGTAQLRLKKSIENKGNIKLKRDTLLHTSFLDNTGNIDSDDLECNISKILNNGNIEGKLIRGSIHEFENNRNFLAHDDCILDYLGILLSKESSTWRVGKNWRASISSLSLSGQTLIGRMALLNIESDVLLSGQFKAPIVDIDSKGEVLCHFNAKLTVNRFLSMKSKKALKVQGEIHKSDEPIVIEGINNSNNPQEDCDIPMYVNIESTDSDVELNGKVATNCGAIKFQAANDFTHNGSINCFLNPEEHVLVKAKNINARKDSLLEITDSHIKKQAQEIDKLTFFKNIKGIFSLKSKESEYTIENDKASDIIQIVKSDGTEPDSHIKKQAQETEEKTFSQSFKDTFSFLNKEPENKSEAEKEKEKIKTLVKLEAAESANFDGKLETSCYVDLKAPNLTHNGDLGARILSVDGKTFKISNSSNITIEDGLFKLSEEIETAGKITVANYLEEKSKWISNAAEIQAKNAYFRANRRLYNMKGAGIYTHNTLELESPFIPSYRATIQAYCLKVNSYKFLPFMGSVSYKIGNFSELVNTPIPTSLPIPQFELSDMKEMFSKDTLLMAGDIGANIVLGPLVCAPFKFIHGTYCKTGTGYDLINTWRVLNETRKLLFCKDDKSSGKAGDKTGNETENGKVAQEPEERDACFYLKQINEVKNAITPIVSTIKCGIEKKIANSKANKNSNADKKESNKPIGKIATKLIEIENKIKQKTQGVRDAVKKFVKYEEAANKISSLKESLRNNVIDKLSIEKFDNKVLEKKHFGNYLVKMNDRINTKKIATNVVDFSIGAINTGAAISSQVIKNKMLPQTNSDVLLSYNILDFGINNNTRCLYSRNDGLSLYLGEHSIQTIGGVNHGCMYANKLNIDAIGKYSSTGKIASNAGSISGYNLDIDGELGGSIALRALNTANVGAKLGANTSVVAKNVNLTKENENNVKSFFVRADNFSSKASVTGDKIAVDAVKIDLKDGTKIANYDCKSGQSISVRTDLLQLGKNSSIAGERLSLDATVIKGAEFNKISSTDGAYIKTSSIDNKGTISGPTFLDFKGKVEQLKNIGNVDNLTYAGTFKDGLADKLVDGNNDLLRISPNGQVKLIPVLSEKVCLEEEHKAEHKLAILNTNGEIVAKKALSFKNGISLQAKGNIEHEDLISDENVVLDAGENINAQSKVERKTEGDNFHDVLDRVKIKAGKDIKVNAGKSVLYSAAKFDAGKEGIKIDAGEKVFLPAVITEKHCQSSVYDIDNKTTTTETINESIANVCEFNTEGKVEIKGEQGYEFVAPKINAKDGFIFDSGSGKPIVHDATDTYYKESKTSKKGGYFGTDKNTNEQYFSSKTKGIEYIGDASSIIRSQQKIDIPFSSPTEKIIIEAPEAKLRAPKNIEISAKNSSTKNLLWQTSSSSYKEDKSYDAYKGEIETTATKFEVDAPENNFPKINFKNLCQDYKQNTLPETHISENLNFQGPTPEASVVICLAVSMATSGVGTAAGSSLAAALGAKGAAATVITKMTATAITTLSCQATEALLRNNGNIVEAAKSLANTNTLKSLVISTATSGAIAGSAELLDYVGIPDISKATNLTEGFKYAAPRQIAEASIRAGANIISGQEVKQALLDATKAATAGTIGIACSRQIGNAYGKDLIDPITHKLLHAGVGAIEGAILGGTKGAVAGAGGALVSETIADVFAPTKPSLNNIISLEESLGRSLSQEEFFQAWNNQYNNYMRSVHSVADASKLLTSTAALLAKQDVSLAAYASDKAIDNNFIIFVVYGIVAADIAYTTYQIYKAFNEGGAEAGLKKLGIEVALYAGGAAAGKIAGKVVFKLGTKCYPTAKAAVKAALKKMSPTAKLAVSHISEEIAIAGEKLAQSEIGKAAIKLNKDYINPLENKLIETQAKIVNKVSAGAKKVLPQAAIDLAESANAFLSIEKEVAVQAATKVEEQTVLKAATKAEGATIGSALAQKDIGITSSEVLIHNAAEPANKVLSLGEMPKPNTKFGLQTFEQKDGLLYLPEQEIFSPSLTPATLDVPNIIIPKNTSLSLISHLEKEVSDFKNVCSKAINEFRDPLIPSYLYENRVRNICHFVRDNETRIHYLRELKDVNQYFKLNQVIWDVNINGKINSYNLQWDPDHYFIPEFDIIKSREMVKNITGGHLGKMYEFNDEFGVKIARINKEINGYRKIDLIHPSNDKLFAKSLFKESSNLIEISDNILETASRISENVIENPTIRAGQVFIAEKSKDDVIFRYYMSINNNQIKSVFPNLDEIIK